MARSLAVVVPGRPPNPNAGARHTHWRDAAREASEWRQAARLVALDAVNRKPGWVPLRRARMAVCFVVGDERQRDLDNLIASTKPLTDGLVDAGVLLDDSTRVLSSVSYSWRFLRGVHATEYLVESDEPEGLGLDA